MAFIQKRPFFRCLYYVLTVVVFACGCMYRSYLEIACALCALLFCLGQNTLVSSLSQDDAVQKQKCKNTGFLLALPAAGMILTGVAFFHYPHTGLDATPIYCVLAISAYMAICHVLWLISLRKNSSVAARFLRLAHWMALSSPASLIIALILIITHVEEVKILGCLTIIIFGGLALLLSLSMVAIARCEYKSFRDSVVMIIDFVKKNRLVFIRFSIAKDSFLVVGKGIISIISSSFFMFVNTLYSVGMGLARFVAVKMHEQDRGKQIKSYRLVGCIIFVASICYGLYSLRLLFGGATRSYSLNVALIIALYTFVEFGINIRDALRLRKSHALEAKALRAISFASTLICFVLTQTAIMSFASEGDTNFADAVSGLFFGGAAAFIGLFVVIQSFYYQKHLPTDETLEEQTSLEEEIAENSF